MNCLAASQLYLTIIKYYWSYTYDELWIMINCNCNYDKNVYFLLNDEIP